MKLQNSIPDFDSEHVEDYLILFPFRPLRTMLFISYKSSSDEPVLLPAEINQDRYKLEDGYKVSLKCTVPGYGTEHVYQSDLYIMFKNGQAQVFKKVEVR